mgnify:CR=1 FL=1
MTIENRQTASARASPRAAVLALGAGARWSARRAARSAARSRPQGAITPNYKDADLSQIIEAVSAVTGKNFIVDPRVRAQVTMLSSTPMSPGRVLRGVPVDPAGARLRRPCPRATSIKIIPDANARQLPGNDLPSRVELDFRRDRHAGHRGRNVSAAQLVPILRPLIPQYGHLAAYPASNMLIISDRAGERAAA